MAFVTLSASATPIAAKIPGVIVLGGPAIPSLFATLLSAVNLAIPPKDEAPPAELKDILQKLIATISGAEAPIAIQAPQSGKALVTAGQARTSQKRNPVPGAAQKKQMKPEAESPVVSALATPTPTLVDPLPKPIWFPLGNGTVTVTRAAVEKPPVTGANEQSTAAPSSAHGLEPVVELSPSPEANDAPVAAGHLSFLVTMAGLSHPSALAMRPVAQAPVGPQPNTLAPPPLAPSSAVTPRVPALTSYGAPPLNLDRPLPGLSAAAPDIRAPRPELAGNLLPWPESQIPAELPLSVESPPPVPQPLASRDVNLNHSPVPERPTTPSLAPPTAPPQAFIPTPRPFSTEPALKRSSPAAAPLITPAAPLESGRQPRDQSNSGDTEASPRQHIQLKRVATVPQPVDNAPPLVETLAPAPLTQRVLVLEAPVEPSRQPASDTFTTPQPAQRAPPALPQQPLPTVASQIAIRLDSGNDNGHVELRIRERAGEVQISVRSSSEGVATALRRDLGELVKRLEPHAASTELSRPDTASSSDPEPLRTIRTDQSPSHSYFSDDPQQQRQRQQHQQQHPNRKPFLPLEKDTLEELRSLVSNLQ